jgi:hypothetical protein
MPNKHRRGSGWRSAWGPDEVVQRVRPFEFTGNLPNPHRGTTTFQRFQGDPLYPGTYSSDTDGPLEFPRLQGRTAPLNKQYIPRTTVAYCRWPWAVIEPKRGQFRWDIIDDSLRSARERGQTLQVLLEPYTCEEDRWRAMTRTKRYPPGKSVNLPAWYWDTGAPWIKGLYTEFEPDPNHLLWAKHFGGYIREAGRRYDGHPDLESVDIGYSGFWGESGFGSTKATAARLTDIFINSFKRTRLITMLGTDGSIHAHKHHPRIGWRVNALGDLSDKGGGVVPDRLCWNHMYDCYPRVIEECGVRDTWERAPVVLEVGWSVADWVAKGWDLDFIIAQADKYHPTYFMPKSIFFPDKALDKLIAFDNRIGYRFVMRQLLIVLESKPGAKINAEVFIDNVGCAPIYRPYKLALRFRQGRNAHTVVFKEDIRRWLPGVSWFKEPVTIPRGLKKGTAEVAVGIVDDTGTPKVRLAIKPQDPDGWHSVAKMNIQ